MRLFTYVTSNLGVVFTHDGDQFYLEYGTLKFAWGVGLQWFLTLEDTHTASNSITQYRGLCGDFNDNPSGINTQYFSDHLMSLIL